MSPNTGAPAPEIPGVELTGVIGSGGSGIVYLGRQTAFGRDVAVKVTSRGSAPDESTRRWEREVAAIGRLSNHPNIVPVFDAGITGDGSPYLVMPYVPQGTLGDRLRDEGPMPPEEVATIGAKLAGTLATVHAAGVLHRDLKPENVLWSPHGEPQLTDFGIARLQDITTTMAGGVHATIAYAAPEVLAGEAASEASDVYGLGATLYACLTGASPHPTSGGESVAALVAKVIEAGPPRLVGTDVPEPLAAVIDRAMSRQPAARQASARDLRHELEEAGAAIVAVVPPTAAVPTSTEPTAPETTRVQPVVPAAVEPAAPRHVSVPAPVPAPDPAPVARSGPTGDGRGPGNRGLWAVALIVIVLFVGLLALALTRDDEPGDAALGTGEEPGTETSDTTDASTTSEPTTTEAPTTTTTTEAPATTEATRRNGGGAQSSSDITDAAVRYIRTLDRGELDAAWALTSPRFQANQDREQWEGFWSSYDEIEIVGDVRADAEAGSAVVPLSLDGQREDYRMDLVRQGGGWLIDGPVGG